MLVKADPILKIAITCIASKHLTNPVDKPISLLLLSSAGNGKTSVLQEASKRIGNAMMIDGTTGSDLEKLIKEKGHKLPSLIIGDLLGINSRKVTTSRNTWRVMQALMWDGVEYMGDAGGRIKFKKPVMTNILTAMPVQLFFNCLSYSSKKAEDKLMAAQGILRRMLVIHYDYFDTSVATIHHSIRQPSKNKPPALRKLKVKRGDPVISKDFGISIMEEAENVPQGIESHGFSYHKIYRAYVKTRALLRRSLVVNQRDMNDLRELTMFVQAFQGGRKI
jgi:hypothetical protein